MAHNRLIFSQALIELSRHGIHNLLIEIRIVKELLEREQYPAPIVKLNPEIKDFYQFTTDDLIVENYQTGPQIKNIPIAI